MALEIERKFLLEKWPDPEQADLKVHSEQLIEQTYLAIDEEQELRVRRLTDLSTGEMTYTHTFKKGNGLLREEVEYAISGSIYDQLVRACGAVALVKKRTTAEFEGRLVEIDSYDQLGLTVLEVEFGSVEEAHTYTSPSWLGRDISEERQYSNKTVWKQLQQEHGRG